MFDDVVMWYSRILSHFENQNQCPPPVVLYMASIEKIDISELRNWIALIW